ncbi:YlbF family regulator [Falsibacillus albus]|uniref:YlbF family regulator n=1 Tax=Falsibacillus albus TaxID=2478915 RepID=A0A3L7JYA8_9BACI|nr:YlbF family regulator [Falsibacillus albus]RLQ95858.1 YlbF family regulator [Falsibacillus albus]
MLATTPEKLELLANAEQLSRMILESDIAENYRICLYHMRKNKDTQDKIKKFSSLKGHYEDAQRFGKYHPDYKRIMKEVREAKRDMDMDDCVAEFRKAETDLQNLLDQISVVIGRSVSEHIKVPTGNPFFDSACSGGCGSGGSCGCSA